MLLDGRVAIVTGASRGIGAVIGLTLASHGASVVVNYLRRREAADEVVHEITAQGGRAVAFQADVADRKGVDSLVEAALTRFGSIDVLVNNAYPGWRGGDISDLDWETYQWYVDGILKAAVNTVQAALPKMRAQGGGSIVNIGTTAMFEFNKNHTPYIAAKGGLLALTRGLATDLGPDNIRVNMVSPGKIWTDRTSPQPDDFVPVARARTPLGRNANADDVAGAVVFFASDLSRFVTGVNLPVCGGFLVQGG